MSLIRPTDYDTDSPLYQPFLTHTDQYTWEPIDVIIGSYEQIDLANYLPFGHIFVPAS